MPSIVFLGPEMNTEARILFFSVTISASIVFSAILYFIFYLLRSLIIHSRTSLVDSTAPQKLQNFSYKQLKSATNCFSESALIGKGGSSNVYLGTLRNGKSIAIKKLDDSSLDSEREFQNELQILSSMKSPFIITLLGYSAGKQGKFLVYDYMQNRSLQESLFSERVPLSSWERRFQIILDIARALAYLHNDCDPGVIHCDVKPSNVLLDLDFRAKLSDFGLSRLKMEEELCSDPSDHKVASRFCSNSRNSDVDLSDYGKNLGCSEEFVVDLSGEMKGSSDWWWKQEGSGELSSKDYVAEWLRSQISPRNCLTKPARVGDMDPFRFGPGRGWRKNTTGSMNSSTTSMKGTLCYAAPEYREFGVITENADVYSFGVLVLVVVSGRRPLEIGESSMELEKANLVSWCRRLVQFGDVMEVVDVGLEGGHEERQVRMCVDLAMWCLQKSSELRPGMAEAVEVLEGKEVPAVQFSFTQSPPMN